MRVTPLDPVLELARGLVEGEVGRRVGVLQLAVLVPDVVHEQLVAGKAHVDRETVVIAVAVMVTVRVSPTVMLERLLTEAPAVLS